MHFPRLEVLLGQILRKLDDMELFSFNLTLCRLPDSQVIQLFRDIGGESRMTQAGKADFGFPYLERAASYCILQKLNHLISTSSHVAQPRVWPDTAEYDSILPPESKVGRLFNGACMG
jgi:hypothetical protein